jgi:hypothetical protein
MKITNPRALLDSVDYAAFEAMKELVMEKGETIFVTEPSPKIGQIETVSVAAEGKKKKKTLENVVSGLVQRFEDHIDTDGNAV